MAYSCGYPDTMNKQVSNETYDKSPLTAGTVMKEFLELRNFLKVVVEKNKLL